MEEHRANTLKQAKVAKFTFGQIINLGKTSTCTAEEKAKAERVKNVLLKKVENVVAGKPRLIFNNEIGEHVPPTSRDIPPGCTEVPDDVLKVQDKPKNGPEEWITVKQLRERLIDQFSNQLWYEH